MRIYQTTISKPNQSGGIEKYATAKYYEAGADEFKLLINYHD
jgi:hypothetical protein